MRKQTAPQIRNNREASSRKQSGLIAQDLSAQQSATPNSVLDNRSHRTSIRPRAEPQPSQPNSVLLISTAVKMLQELPPGQAS